MPRVASQGAGARGVRLQARDVQLPYPAAIASCLCRAARDAGFRPGPRLSSSEVLIMRKLVIASLLVAGVALSGVVLAQTAAPKAAATKTEQAAAPAPKKTMTHHHHAHKAMKKSAEKPAAGK
ncbi:hypothetical protein [Frateuria sp. YIM B11624]|uniref:hypothetical protein n=1 Tax=Frateuria sp. YIM B11624 TaxID=3143185 RepID=UPI003C796A61